MNEKDRRRRRIVEVLQRDGDVKPSDLARELSVSLVTVRRDLRELAEQRRISVGYGFVRLQASPSGAERTFSQRLLVNVEAKRSLARRAMETIVENDVIFLGSGTTCFFLAELLVRHFSRLHVVTNGLKSLEVLGTGRGFSVECVGGSLLPGFNSLVGPKAEAALKTAFFTKSFLSCASYRLTSGVYDLSPFTAGVKQAVLANSEHLCLMVDAGKVDAAAPSLIASADAFHTVVTDSPDLQVPTGVSVILTDR